MSRIIGVEVHCGPVHGTILYYVDNLVSGGANLIIEVTKQGMSYYSNYMVMIVILIKYHNVQNVLHSNIRLAGNA